MKHFKLSRYIFYLNIIYWIIYNSHFGWNYKPKTEAEEIYDGIFIIGLVISFTLYIYPALKWYEKMVEAWETKRVKIDIEISEKDV